VKKLSSIFFVSVCALVISLPAMSQSCTSAVCTAASPNQSDVLAALPSSGNSNATVVVNIPAGTASWTSGINYTVPSGVTNLTIQGQSSINWSGTAGTSSYTYSVSDRTVIQDGIPDHTYLMRITTGGSNTQFRMTGLTIEGGSGGTGYSKYGAILFLGNSNAFRFDHNHIDNTTYGSSGTSTATAWVRVYGGIKGVLDHNFINMGTNTTISGGFEAYNAVDDNIGMGDGSWASSTGWGSDKFLFMESNYYIGGAPNDCAEGGRFVMRYNTINSAYVGIQTHATKSAAGPGRGCRAYEAYHNYLTGPNDQGQGGYGASRASGATGSKQGSALVWGNTMAEGYYRFFQANTDRATNAVSEGSQPGNWGYCGTDVNGSGSSWDGNSNSTTGWPCMDGLGRGQDTQKLNGASTISARVNTATGSQSWPHQYLEPIYMWNNTIPSGFTYVMIGSQDAQNNRDYYFDCGSFNSSCSGSFNGSAGTGYGPLGSRPSSCTAGPGGTYGTSPSGSYGVAYFATDSNTLYVCSSANTWTAIYKPYTYPHPLVSGTSNTSSTPPAPTGLVSTVY